MPRVAPGEPMPKTTDKMLAAFDAKGVMVSITLRYTRPGLSAPTYLARPWRPLRMLQDRVHMLECAPEDLSMLARQGSFHSRALLWFTALGAPRKCSWCWSSTSCMRDALHVVMSEAGVACPCLASSL